MEYEVEIPEKVEVDVSSSLISVKGEKGELKREFNLDKIKIEKKDSTIVFSMENPRTKEKAYLGTVAAHLKNMIRGVSKGYVYKMKIVFAHFPINVSIEGNKIIIKNFAGEKTPRHASIVGDTKVEIKGQEIEVINIDKEAAGQTAANIEQATRIRGRDPRVFNDGIYITGKPEREFK